MEFFTQTVNVLKILVMAGGGIVLIGLKLIPLLSNVLR